MTGRSEGGRGGEGGPDWNAEIKPGPLEIGFDSAFIMAATGDRVPVRTSGPTAIVDGARGRHAGRRYLEPVGANEGLHESSATLHDGRRWAGHHVGQLRFVFGQGVCHGHDAAGHAQQVPEMQ